MVKVPWFKVSRFKVFRFGSNFKSLGVLGPWFGSRFHVSRYMVYGLVRVILGGLERGFLKNRH